MDSALQTFVTHSFTRLPWALSRRDLRPRLARCYAPRSRRFDKRARRGGRAAEGARLESVYAGNRIAGSNPAPSASYYVLDIGYIIVFLGSLFSREFAGVTGLVFKAIRGRDGFTRDFGCGRYENLSGAISWLTFSRAEQPT